MSPNQVFKSPHRTKTRAMPYMWIWLVRVKNVITINVTCWFYRRKVSDIRTKTGISTVLLDILPKYPIHCFLKYHDVVHLCNVFTNQKTSISGTFFRFRMNIHSVLPNHLFLIFIYKMRFRYSDNVLILFKMHIWRKKCLSSLSFVALEAAHPFTFQNPHNH